MGTAVVLVVAVLVGSFLLLGVLPTLRRTRDRLERVEAFDNRYKRWVAGGSVEGEDRTWLIARRAKMQCDAMVVGRGVSYIAPPPMFGGPMQSHQMFLDLTNEQAYSGMLIDEQTRTDELATIIHTLQGQLKTARRRLFNPFEWVRLAFERVARFPRYLLRTAGFPESVTDSSLARAASVLWGLVVGGATIGAFVLCLVKG